MRHFLSARDRQLLQRRFRIKEPQKFPGLTERLEKGATPVHIIHSYDETPPGGRKKGHKPHIRCAFGHLHWHGFIVELDDRRIALIGRDCARDHFGKEVIDDIEERFEAAKDRQFQVRRLIAIREALPAAVTELRALAASTAVQGFDVYWATMSHRFGKLIRLLAGGVRSSQGKLVASQSVIDKAATFADARKAASKLVEGTDEFSLFEKTTTEDVEERRIAIARWTKFLEKQPTRYKLVPLDIGVCDAWTLCKTAERSTPARLVAEAISLADGLNLDHPTEKWTKLEFAEMRNTLDGLFAKLDDATGLVADLNSFTSPANIGRVAAWAKQVEVVERKIGQDIRAEGRALVGNDRLELPEGYVWPRTPHLAVLRAALENTVEAQALAA